MSENYPYLSVVLEALLKRAQERNLNFSVEKSTGYCGLVTIHNRVIGIHGADPGLNSSSSARISNDKYFTEQFLKENGLNSLNSLLIKGGGECVDPLPDMPCIIKPNTGFGGQGFSLVKKENEIAAAIDHATQFDDLILIQPYYTKREFRLVVLDGEVLYAYERTPWKIRGDGQSSIAEFLKRKTPRHAKSPKFDLQDPLLLQHLRQKNLSLVDIPGPGESIQLFDSANLSKGGGWETVRDLHPGYIALAAKAARVIGLRYAGIDLFCDTSEKFDEQYRIIEVNANPGYEYLRANPSLMEAVFDKFAIALFD